MVGSVHDRTVHALLVGRVRVYDGRAGLSHRIELVLAENYGFSSEFDRKFKICASKGSNGFFVLVLGLIKINLGKANTESSLECVRISSFLWRCFANTELNASQSWLPDDCGGCGIVKQSEFWQKIRKWTPRDDCQANSIWVKNNQG